MGRFREGCPADSHEGSGRLDSNPEQRTGWGRCFTHLYKSARRTGASAATHVSPFRGNLLGNVSAAARPKCLPGKKIARRIDRRPPDFPLTIAEAITEKAPRSTLHKCFNLPGRIRAIAFDTNALHVCGVFLRVGTGVVLFQLHSSHRSGRGRLRSLSPC